MSTFTCECVRSSTWHVVSAHVRKGGHHACGGGGAAMLGRWHTLPRCLLTWSRHRLVHLGCCQVSGSRLSSWLTFPKRKGCRAGGEYLGKKEATRVQRRSWPRARLVEAGGGGERGGLTDLRGQLSFIILIYVCTWYSGYKKCYYIDAIDKNMINIQFPGSHAEP